MKYLTDSKILVTGLLIALVSLGCGSDPAPTSLSSFQPEIINAQDSFQFQATGLTGVTTTVTYTWDNTGTQATVNHSSAITAGTTLMELLDDSGVMVYSDSLKASANEPTAAGVAGTWTVRVTLTGVRGTLNFRAEAL